MAPVVILLAFLSRGLGQVSGTPGHVTDPPVREPLRTLVDSALTTPPEIAADLLIRSSGISGPRVVDRLEWLDRAFRLAGSATHKLPLVPAYGRGYQTDSNAGTTGMALALGLDTLSLQSRAITSTLALDRGKAMDLFRSLPQPRVPSVGCQAAMVFSVSAYHDLIRAVYARGYTPKQRKDEEDFRLLYTVISAMSSPIELDPALRLVMLPEDTAQSDRLLTTYSTRLREILGDDRSFAATVSTLLHDCERLIAVLSARKISAYKLIDALRSYLVRHLAASRCSGSTDFQSGGKVAQPDVDFFNGALRTSGGVVGEQVEPITASQIKPQEISTEPMDVRVYWSTAYARRLLTDLKRLRFGSEEQRAEIDKLPKLPDGRTPSLSLRQRSETEWNAALREYLKDLERWKQDHTENDVDYFHMASIIYHSLIELIPIDELKRQVFRSNVAFLRQSSLAQSNPPEWLFQANRLLKISGVNDTERAWMHDEITASGDTIMSLYVQLDSLARPHSKE